jgi:hypothetical protein
VARSTGSIVFDPSIPTHRRRRHDQRGVFGIGTTFDIFGKLAPGVGRRSVRLGRRQRPGCSRRRATVSRAASPTRASSSR